MFDNLESAIKHCEEVAEDKEYIANKLLDRKSYKIVREDYLKCASEHRQLAEWLKALKEIWDSGDCNDCKFKGMCATEPKLGQMVRYNCYGYSRKEVDENDT